MREGTPLNLEVDMVVVCPDCRELVHVSAGYLLRHGSKAHGKLHPCSGSGKPYAQDCCGI